MGLVRFSLHGLEADASRHRNSHAPELERHHLAPVGAACGRPASKMRYVFQSPVVSTDSQWFIDRAFQLSGRDVATWPGVDFDMTTDEGKGILASPNDSGLVWLLLSRRRQLGSQTISKVTVFADDGKREPVPPSLVSYIVDEPSLGLKKGKGLLQRPDSGVANVVSTS